MRDYNFNFKDKIEKICTDNDLTLNALAAKTGIPPTTVYRLAKGESEIPDLVTILNICDTFGYDLNVFLDREKTCIDVPDDIKEFVLNLKQADQHKKDRILGYWDCLNDNKK